MQFPHIKAIDVKARPSVAEELGRLLQWTHLVKHHLNCSVLNKWVAALTYFANERIHRVKDPSDYIFGLCMAATYWKWKKEVRNTLSTINHLNIRDVSYTIHYQLGVTFVPHQPCPGDIWQCLETFLFIPTRGLLLKLSEQRPLNVLNIFQYTEWSPNKELNTYVSIALSLRSSALYSDKVFVILMSRRILIFYLLGLRPCSCGEHSPPHWSYPV